MMVASNRGFFAPFFGGGDAMMRICTLFWHNYLEK